MIGCEGGKKTQQLLSAHPPLIIGDSCEGLVSFLALSLGPGSGAARRTHIHAHTDGTRTMAATHGEYRGYLRNTVDMEAGQHRFHSVQSSESTYRPLLFGTLAVMGLLQVASSVAILLHLTGYLQEVGSPFFSYCNAVSTFKPNPASDPCVNIDLRGHNFSLPRWLDALVEIYAILLRHKNAR